MSSEIGNLCEDRTYSSTDPRVFLLLACLAFHLVASFNLGYYKPGYTLILQGIASQSMQHEKYMCRPWHSISINVWWTLLSCVREKCLLPKMQIVLSVPLLLPGKPCNLSDAKSLALPLSLTLLGLICSWHILTIFQTIQSTQWQVFSSPHFLHNQVSLFNCSWQVIPIQLLPHFPLVGQGRELEE